MVKVQLIFVLFIFCAGTKYVVTEDVTDTVEDTLKFVNNAQKQLDVTQHSEIILVIGKTGIGKSTLVHYVACDYSKIISIDDGISLNYIVRDELDTDLNVSISTTESRTLIPAKIVDDEQIVWYDNPGFEDTRSQTMEIATTFLLKSVVESASKLKFVLVSDYNAFSDSRNDFDKLLIHTTQLIKNVKRFENSVSLVVTKVPSFKIRGRRYFDITDESVEHVIAQFMRDHRAVLQAKGPNEQNKIQLIDSLLKQSNDGDYERISIFWRPNDVGPFDTIHKLISGRQKIRDSILNETSYAEMHKSDFGFPLTADAQMRVASLAQRTIDKISMTLEKINDDLQVELVQRIKSVDSFHERLELIEIAKRIVESKSSDVLMLSQLTDKFKNLIQLLKLTTIEMAYFNQIEQHEHNLNIFGTLMESEKVPPNSDLKTILEDLSEFFANLQNNIQSDIKKKAQQLVNSISADLMNFDKQLQLAFQRKLQSIDGFQNKLAFVQLGKNCTRSAKEEVTLHQRTEQLKFLAHTMNETSIVGSDVTMYTNRILNAEIELKYLTSMATSEIIVPVHEWIARSSNTIDYQCSEYDWYSFLEEVFVRLSKYEIQKDVTAYNVANLEDWGKLNKTQGLVIDQHNFNQFTNQIARDSEFVSTSSKLEELNEIVNITLKSSPTYECSNGIMTIKGVFVKSSHIEITKCSSHDVKKINVFAIDTFYVNGDLNFNEIKGVEVSILTYAWNVITKATFYLNGANGKSQVPPMYSGTAGRPGHLGTNSGNFFGLANKVINGHLLTVELIGGRGGDGQDGSGSPDIRVTYSRTYNTQTYCERPAFKYLRKLMKSESGINHVEMINEEEYLKDYAFVWAAKEMKCTFRLYSNQCCGVTGSGGPGKKQSIRFML